MNKPQCFNLKKIPSFLGLPVGDLEDLSSEKTAVAGYFCDNLNAPSPGKRFLARQLRYASSHLDAPKLTDELFSLAIDVGDLNVFPLQPEKHFQAVVNQCQAILNSGSSLVLVGGDASGLQALAEATRGIIGTGSTVITLKELAHEKMPVAQQIVLAVDLDQLAGRYRSRPSRVAGLSPGQIIHRINTAPGQIIAAALYGLAPSLDFHGNTETRAALAILAAIIERMRRGKV